MGVTPARHLREQERVEKEKDKGRQANESKFTEFDIGCSEGYASACNSLGEWYAMLRQDFVKAKDLYHTACIKDNYPQACLNLGSLLVRGGGDVPIDRDNALVAFTRGCELGNADSCAHAGRLLLQKAASGSLVEAPRTATSDGGKPAGRTGSGSEMAAPELVASAESLLRRGCEQGTSTTNARCCGMLASLYMSPRLSSAPGVPRVQGQRLVDLMTTACEGEQAPACRALASLYRQGGAPPLGISLPKNETKADSYDLMGLRWLGMTDARAAREIEVIKARAAAATAGTRGAKTGAGAGLQ